MRTSAHNHLKLDINGTRISGYVTPAPSNPEKEKLFLTYDITERIVEGANRFDAKVLYLGGGGQNYVDGKPGFILEAFFWYEDGTKETLVSDTSWKVLIENAYESHMPYQQNRRVTPVECFDAGKEKQIRQVFRFLMPVKSSLAGRCCI